MASADCKCEKRFTCKHCLANAKPYFFTCDDGSVIYLSRVQPIKENDNALL